MRFPLNRSAAKDVVSALTGRGVTPSQVASALDIPVRDAAILFSSENPQFTVAQAKRIEAFIGIPFVTLAIEGLYRRPSQTSAQLSLLDSTHEIFPNLDPAIAATRSARLAASRATATRVTRRQRAS